MDLCSVVYISRYDSPRIQKLAIFILQQILPIATTPLTFSMICKDSLLNKYMEHNHQTDNHRSERYPALTNEEVSNNEMDEYYIYTLLHYCTHNTCCPSALYSECPSCALCCSFFPYIYRYFHKNTTTSYPSNLSFNSICAMNIRVTGYDASYVKSYTSEEVVYLLRLMLNKDRWRKKMISIFETILKTASEQILLETKGAKTYIVSSSE